MSLIRLINPNTSERTTAMMVAIARDALDSAYEVAGVTAAVGVTMITNEAELNASAAEVLRMGVDDPDGVAGVIVSAFGDPGKAELQDLLDIPVVGICEASLQEAAQGGRRFGIATVTPGLVEVIASKVRQLGLTAQFTGTRLTDGDPVALTGEPAQLLLSLEKAVETSLKSDHAEAVIIGGGPLGQAAIGLSERLSAPIIAPIPAAARQLVRRLTDRKGRNKLN